ncbi:hypothetical protein [Nocardiopsis sp. NPDC006938]
MLGESIHTPRTELLVNWGPAKTDQKPDLVDQPTYDEFTATG